MDVLREKLLRAANIAIRRPERTGGMRIIINSALRKKYPDSESEELERMTTNVVRNGPYKVIRHKTH